MVLFTVIISICWFAGTIIGFLPLLGWHKGPAENGRCFFLGVMDYNYLVFLYFGTIITPALLLAIFYAHIYHVVLRQLRRQIVSINSTPYHHNNKTNKGGGSGGTMLRVLGAAQKREVKATQNLSIIVLFFMICWIPLYTINCVLAFCKDCKINSTFMLSCIILSHLNSAGNPLLYAYHLKDFRAALKSFICNLFGIKVRQPPAAANNVRAFAFNNHFHYRLHSVRDQPRTTNSSLSFAQQHHQQQDINNGFGMSSRRANTLPLGGNDRRKLSAITSQTSSRINNDFVWRISELSDEGLEKRSMSLDAGSENDEVFLPNGKQNFDGQLLNPRNLNISKSTPHLSNSSLPKESMQSIQCLNETKSTCEEVTDGPPKETCDTSSSYVSDAGDFIHSPAKSVKLSPFRAFHEAIMKSANIRSVTQRSTSLTDERCSMDIGKDNNSFH